MADSRFPAWQSMQEEVVQKHKLFDGMPSRRYPGHRWDGSYDSPFHVQIGLNQQFPVEANAMGFGFPCDISKHAVSGGFTVVVSHIEGQHPFYFVSRVFLHDCNANTAESSTGVVKTITPIMQILSSRNTTSNDVLDVVDCTASNSKMVSGRSHEPGIQRLSAEPRSSALASSSLAFCPVKRLLTPRLDVFGKQKLATSEGAPKKGFLLITIHGNDEVGLQFWASRSLPPSYIAHITKHVLSPRLSRDEQRPLHKASFLLQPPSFSSPSLL
ncbi:uncharacterized protein CLUP02_08618 [Colletotrichum lupini]|uniref:Uncharacterized protein n=1 Tax=Colletotrichum lupini TaxID=145971 RepID=A0A9Q8SU67_9PEZI|nr:uncharacterized protein CLUP02_08618 [Colletotrichum lupini]UQC83125.1 hypothetical protein CLUP02_08618 [Colletotrichum lupini]